MWMNDIFSIPFTIFLNSLANKIESIDDLRYVYFLIKIDFLKKFAWIKKEIQYD